MSVSGNVATPVFPETRRQRAEPSTDRVRRHRANRTTVRVEVEVPTPDDALAVKRFARQRRQDRRDIASTSPAAEPNTTDFADIIDGLSPLARNAVATFIQAVTMASDHELIDRAARVAANYEDAVRRASHGSKITR